MTQKTEDVVAQLREPFTPLSPNTREFRFYIIGLQEVRNRAADLIERQAVERQSLSDRLAVQDDLLRRVRSLIRPYCAADEELRAFRDELMVCLVEGKE